MAITWIDYELFGRLRRSGHLRPGGRLLEIGEANWYGDVPVDRLLADIEAHVSDPVRQSEMTERVRQLVQRRPPRVMFSLAELYWEMLFRPSVRRAVDLHGTPRAWPYDLNHPLPIEERFDVVLDLGTAEHVFDVCQLFRSVHELTVSGGLMVHGVPFQGWPDHGFYSFHPTFFFDLAEANGYELLALEVCTLRPTTYAPLVDRAAVGDLVRRGGLARHALLYGVLRKGADGPFQIPMQNHYSDRESAAAASDWEQLKQGAAGAHRRRGTP